MKNTITLDINKQLQDRSRWIFRVYSDNYPYFKIYKLFPEAILDLQREDVEKRIPGKSWSWVSHSSYVLNPQYKSEFEFTIALFGLSALISSIATASTEGRAVEVCDDVWGEEVEVCPSSSCDMLIVRRVSMSRFIGHTAVFKPLTFIHPITIDNALEIDMNVVPEFIDTLKEVMLRLLSITK